MDWKQNFHTINKSHSKNLDLTYKSKCETKSILKYYSNNSSAKIEIDLTNVKNHGGLFSIMSIVTKCKSLHHDLAFSAHSMQNGNLLLYDI